MTFCFSLFPKFSKNKTLIFHYYLALLLFFLISQSCSSLISSSLCFLQLLLAGGSESFFFLSSSRLLTEFFGCSLSYLMSLSKSSIDISFESTVPLPLELALCSAESSLLLFQMLYSLEAGLARPESLCEAVIFYFNIFFSWSKKL